MDAVDIWIWRVWVLDKTIAGWVNHLKVEREVATLAQSLHLLDKLVNLSSDLWVVLSALLLHLADALNSGEEVPLDRLDGAFLGLRRDLEVKLGNADSSEFTFNDGTI